MIDIINKDLLDSHANFIVHQVNCIGTMDNGIALQIADAFPHVEREYMRYIQHCKKRHVNPLGTVLYVPKDYWALLLIDRTTSTYATQSVVPYDNEYQYIVNLFGQQDIIGSSINLKAVKNALLNIRENAELIGASVAIPYNFGCIHSDMNWNDVFKIIRNVFEDSSIDVEICRSNKR